jgi:hypothetical protein
MNVICMYVYIHYHLNEYGQEKVDYKELYFLGRIEY